MRRARPAFIPHPPSSCLTSLWGWGGVCRRMLAAVVGREPGARPSRREAAVVSEAYPETEFNLYPSSASAGRCPWGGRGGERGVT